MKTTTLPVTDRARRVVQSADAERRRLGHPVLTPQHVLWALLAEKGSVADAGPLRVAFQRIDP